jgi:opacity protein-like surface antigen
MEKNMKKSLALSIAVACLAGASAAMAADGDDTGFYVMGGAGQMTGGNVKSVMDNALTGVGGAGFGSSYSNPGFFKLQVGYQLEKRLAIEGGFLGSNNATYSASGGNLAAPINASAKVNGWNLTWVGLMPLNAQFSLLGKLGASNLKVSTRLVGPAGDASQFSSKSALTYGLGAKYDFTKTVFARFDVDSYRTGTSSSSRDAVWMIDIGYKF